MAEVLQLHALRPAAQAALERDHVVHRADLAPDPEALVAEVGARIEAVVTSGHVPLPRALLDRLPRLGIVACGSAGTESLDVDALRERGIPLTNSSPALADDVADLALLLLLAAWRRLLPMDAWVRSGDWARQGAFPLGRSLRGKRLGIAGLGTIGRALALRAEPLGLEIAYFARSPRADAPWRFEPDLPALARDSDILAVIVPGGEATRGLVSRGVIEALGPEGCLVNVSRGSVVDEPALIAALAEGRLGAAGLDVFASEPDPDPRLAALPTVVLTPHHASGTEETRDAMAQLVVDNLAAHAAGRPLPSRVA